MKKVLVLFAVVLMCAGVANAQVIVEENFNYTDGALLTNNGWTAHSGGTAGAITITSGGGLSYAGYASSGIGNAALVDSTGQDVSSIFTPVTSGILYFSALVNVNNAVAGYFLHLAGSATNFAARVHVGPSTTPGKINFWLSNRSNDAVPTGVTDFDPLTTYLLVVKYDVSTTGSASLWVYSSGVPADESSAGVPEDTTENTGQASIDRICLRQYNVAQNYTVDGIRIGNDWADAPVPVELTSFNAIAKGRGVELAWKTATEVNNHGFEIEKAVVSAQSSASVWSKIGFVEGHGTTNAPQSYSFLDAKAEGTVSYRLKQIDRDGQFEYHNAVEVVMSQIPLKHELMQNYPNPFNPSTAITYSVPNTGKVSLSVYDMLGKEVASLVNGVVEAGVHSVQFNASQLPSGMYFYTIQANNFTETKKMTLVK